MDYKSCVGKICRQDELNPLGTGFLISRNILITAKHVIDGANIDKGEIVILFKELKAGIIETHVVDILPDDNKDIVLIKLDTDFEKFLNIDISNFSAYEEFSTFGYSARKVTHGEKIYGQVLIEDFKNNSVYDLDLHCPDFEGLRSDMFKGISGAPIVSSHGLVKGIITKKPDFTDSFVGIKFARLIDFFRKNNIEYNFLEYNIPEIDMQYVQREEDENIISKLIFENEATQIYGLSGIGKTQLAVKVINLCKHSFEKLCWINVKDQEDDKICFSNVILLGEKNPINLEEIIWKYKTLVVIDNLNSNIQNVIKEFSDISQKKSKLLITSLEQVVEEKYSYQVTYLKFETAKHMMQNSGLRFDETVLGKFLTRVDKHPLLLRLITELLKLGKGLTLEEIIEDFDNIHKIEDKGNSIKFFQRIVSRYVDRYKEFLSHLVTVDNLFIEKVFLKKFGAIQLEELISASIVNENNTSFYYVHQIVLNSLKEIILKNDYINKFEIILKNYLEKSLDKREVYYFKFIYNHINLLERLFEMVDDSYSKVLIYNAIVNYKSQDQFMDEVISNIDKMELDLTRYFDIKLHIEKMEFETRRLERGKKRDLILERIGQLRELIQINSSPKNRLLLLHHIAKFYVWIQEYTEAEKIFLEIKENDEEAYSSSLQMARLYKNMASKANVPERNDYILKGTQCLSNIFEGENQPLTVLLGAYELVSMKPYNDLINKYVINKFDKFEIILKESINKEFDQIYFLIKDFSGWLSYKHPQFYKKILEYLKPPVYLQVNKKLLLAYGQIFAKEYTRKKHAGENCENDLRTAERYLIEYIGLIKDDDNKFDYKYLIDLYNESGNFSKADELVNVIYNDNDPYHLKWKCIILRGLSQLTDSKEKIEKAIEMVEKPENKKKYYKSAFYHEYADTLFAMKDPNCIKYLDQAIESEYDNDTCSSWKRKLSIWKKELNIK